jgi:transcriptional antiterminator RfaH
MPDGADIDVDATRWYACYTRARHEKRVDAMLRERGVESYLPLIARERQWKDRKKLVDFAMFPSYVFARFALSAVHQVLTVPGVAALVKADGRPVAVDDEELENVRRFATALRDGELDPEPRPFFAQGQWVEVTDGPFSGVRGIVVEQRRVRVGLRAIGMGYDINVDARVLHAILAP